MKNAVSKTALMRQLAQNHNKFVELTQANISDLQEKMKKLNNTLAYMMVKNEVLVGLLSTCNPPITSPDEFEKMTKDRLIKTIEEAQKTKESKNVQEETESEVSNKSL